MKYIMFETRSGKIPVIFSSFLTHVSVASLLRESVAIQIDDKSVKATSAGFYDQLTGEVKGDSFTLKLKSDPEDEEIIRKQKDLY